MCEDEERVRVTRGMIARVGYREVEGIISTFGVPRGDEDGRKLEKEGMRGIGFLKRVFRNLPSCN